VTIDQAHELALQHHQAGRLAEAEALYRQILAVQPQHADALHNLGIIARQVGRSDVAVDLIRQSILSNPAVAEAHHNLGNVLKDEGRTGEAVAAYRRALELKPDYAEAHNNLGDALRSEGRFAEAFAACRRALQLRPDFAEAHNNLGNALKELGRFAEAMPAYRQAIQLKRDFPEAQVNLGNALVDRGHFDEAITVYRRALELKPGCADLHLKIGNALSGQGCFEEAIAAYRQAVQIKPDYAEAHNNLGAALKERGRLNEALTAYGMAIQLKPDYADAHNNLGSAYWDQHHLDEAVAAYRHAVQLRPDFAEGHYNLSNTLLIQGHLHEAVAASRRAIQVSPAHAGMHSNLLLNLHYLPDLDPEESFEDHCRFAQVHARPLEQSTVIHGNDRNPERRLRVGYVSPDFRGHSVALFLESLLAEHDSTQVEVYCYADLLREDEFTKRFQQLASQWRRIGGMKDEPVTDLIRKDRIDILVDLAGHTANNRLLVFARKAAPVQVTWLGYCDTTGMAAMDYRFTDAYADPPGSTEHLHSEELIRLPDVFACFRPLAESPSVNPVPALADGRVTFASFHTIAKLNQRLLERWSRILVQVPGSRLLMASAWLDEDSCQKRMRDVFGGKGIDPERLEFKGHLAPADYLMLHQKTDVLLDSYPFTGHTIGCHALWMGVPVVTLAGKTHFTRMVGSVLSALGLPELIAGSEEEYVEIAVKLAGDLPRLAHLRATLRERMRNSPVTDAPRFARNVEAAYRQMWRAWCNKQCSNPAS